ncbi:MAG TPA: arylsulfatase [Planctomycetota bacterium]|nr:arylsulfatase [Planctomycetota bacterium]
MRTLLVLTAAAAALSGSGSADPSQGRKPNIIFIHADDLGYGDLSCYGQQKFRTPNIDRLAAEGIRFTQYYAGSTVCAPSRYALMCGYHMGHAWIRGNGDFPLRDEDVTVAEVLKAAGYATGVMGKWGLGREGTEGLPSRQGFDEHLGFLTHGHPHRQYTDHLFRDAERVTVDPQAWANDLVADAALEFVRKHRARPFFLYWAVTVPHAEIRVPEEELEPFRGRFPETPFVNRKADEDPARGYRSQATPKAAFAAMIARMDRHVGRLLALLKELGIDGDTVVFFSSDNGPHKEGGADPEFFGSAGPLRGIKRDLYEGGIRVPMIVRWPGKIPAGAVSDHVWAHWDFLPTAAELAGAKPPEGIDGVSMAPALFGKPARAHEFLYWEFHERGFQQAVRWGDWKAVRLGPGRPLELYDLKSDVGERQDVAARHPEVVSRIEEYLKTARTESPRWPGTRPARTK